MIKATVLLIDDDAAIRNLLSCILEDEGYRVLQAEDPSSLQQGLVAGPDLVLLDLAMPRLDAAAVSQRLRGDAATAHIPIVIVSAYPPHIAPPGLVADAWVLKPFNLDQLCRVVEEWSGSVPSLDR